MHSNAFYEFESRTWYSTVANVMNDPCQVFALSHRVYQVGWWYLTPQVRSQT